MSRSGVYCRRRGGGTIDRIIVVLEKTGQLPTIFCFVSRNVTVVAIDTGTVGAVIVGVMCGLC